MVILKHTGLWRLANNQFGVRKGYDIGAIRRRFQIKCNHVEQPARAGADRRGRLVTKLLYMKISHFFDFFRYTVIKVKCVE